MRTSEVLNKAADLIEQQGWTTGCQGWNLDGDPLCLEGAIYAALGMSHSDFREEYRSGVGHPVFMALQTYLNFHSDWLFLWNDSQESGEQVIEVLRSCALIEAMKETNNKEMVK